MSNANVQSRSILYIGGRKQISGLPSDLKNGGRAEWSWRLCMVYMDLLTSAPSFYMVGIIIVVETLTDSKLWSKDALFY